MQLTLLEALDRFAEITQLSGEQWWDRYEALPLGEQPQDCRAVGCPKCGAKPGQKCVRPSGHRGPLIGAHAARWDLLLAEAEARQPKGEPMPKQRDGRTIYVPVADSHLRNMIRPGSGIVGTADPDSGRIVIDYEGAIYGQSMSYEDKIFHAWGRHTHGEHGYPTVARAWVESEQLLEVGFLTIADPTDADVVAELEARYGDRVPREFLTNT